MHYLFKIIFRKRNFELAPKNTYRRKTFTLQSMYKIFFTIHLRKHRRKSLSMHVVYKIFFTKQKIEDASSNIYWMYKNCFTKKWLEATPKNTYRRKPLSMHWVYKNFFTKRKIEHLTKHMYKIILRNWTCIKE